MRIFCRRMEFLTILKGSLCKLIISVALIIAVLSLHSCINERTPWFPDVSALYTSHGLSMDDETSYYYLNSGTRSNSPEVLTEEKIHDNKTGFDYSSPIPSPYRKGRISFDDRVYYTSAITSREPESRDIAPEKNCEIRSSDDIREKISERGNTAGSLENRFRFEKFSAGIIASEKNSHLITSGNSNGLYYGTPYGFSLTNDFGIHIRYAHNYRWSFEGGYLFRSAITQDFKQLSEGITVSDHYKLNYSAIEFTTRYRLDKPSKIKTPAICLVGGVYLASLNSATETADGNESDITALFKPHDYGITVGGEIEYTLFKRLAVAPGLRVKYGLGNIARDSENISARNASVELRLTISIPLKGC